MANVLVVGPHPDDQELGMGGTIARLADQGHRVLLVDVTDGEPTPHGSPEIRAREAADAAAILSAPGNPVRRVQLGLRNRRVEHTLEARHRMAGTIRAHGAQVVFVPFAEDAHPDHRAVTRIVEDARFDAKLTGVEMPAPEGMEAGPPIYPKWLIYYYATHLRVCPAPSFVMDVTAQHERKMAAILAYRSQFEVNEKNRSVVDWVRAAGVYFGSRIGTGVGEPFYTPEPIGLLGIAEVVL
jgi:bacillithiol biosynthesis deacetylase BshB1